MITVRSTPNIALIKYWGNRNDELRLPAADSLSMTLDGPTVEIDIESAETFTVESFNPDGSEKILSPKDIARFKKHLSLTNQYLEKLQTNPIASVSLTIRSQIPPKIGLASSAAVFSGVAKAYAEFIQKENDLSDEEISVIARLGSGSASRSIFSGFSALEAGEGDAIDSARSVQIADENHWKLYDVVIVPSLEEKKVGSSEGHPIAHTSEHFKNRVEAIYTRRQQECIDAVMQKDFEKLQIVSEEDALDMHRVMETSTPPLRYLSDKTHQIIAEVTNLREAKHLPVLYTMDAGPTVHLICPNEAIEAIRAFAGAQNDCKIFEACVGPGAHSL